MRVVNKYSVAIIIPVHNEQETIGNVIEGVRRSIDATVIVSDDCSSDASVDIAREQADIVLTATKNRGNGAATKRALRHIRNQPRVFPGLDYVLRIDGDGQHDPSLLPDVIGRLDTGADVVVCSRFNPLSDTSAALDDRKFLNATAALWVKEVTGWNVTDARSGFLGFRWPMLAHIVDDLRTERYGIPMELLLRFWKRFPGAVHEEVAHPAMYHRGISKKLNGKYASETISAKVGRLTEAYQVFLSTYLDLGLGMPMFALDVEHPSQVSIM